MAAEIVVLWICKTVILLSLLYKIKLSQNARRYSPDHGTSHSVLVENLPRICVQVPLFNEPDDAASVIRSVAGLNWPRDRFEIQILDDSTDSTSQVVRSAVDALKSTQPDLQISILHRTTRIGYKAGALKLGMERSHADFFAVFDCDFRPSPDFLVCLMPSFSRTDVGAVQAVWSYYNWRANWLTRMQALLLNHHFMSEQLGRAATGLYFNFNGTAGIWRRLAIEEAGGWNSEAVTEDLLLSYRAQLRGWKIVLRENVDCPSALPECLKSFLVQQKRWALGNAQVLKLVVPEIIMSLGLRSRITLDAIFHLAGYGLVTLVPLLLVLMPFLAQSLGRWYKVSNYLEPLRLVDVGLTVCLVLSFFGLYCSRRLYSPGISIFARLATTIGLLFSAPFFAALIAPHFWRGLWRTDKLLVFHRTPKGSARIASTFLSADLLTIIVVIGVSLINAALGQLNGLGITAGASLIQAAIIGWLVLPTRRSVG